MKKKIGEFEHLLIEHEDNDKTVQSDMVRKWLAKAKRQFQVHPYNKLMLWFKEYFGEV